MATVIVWFGVMGECLFRVVAHAQKIHSMYLGKVTQMDESTWSYDEQRGE